MKHRGLLPSFWVPILFLFSVQNIFAQTNTFPPSGNAGIGTTNPSSELDIKSLSGNDAEIHINAGLNGDQSIIRFRDAGQSTWGFLSNYPSAGKFSWYNYQNSSVTVLADQYGRVGIGTVSPSTLLHLNSASSKVELTVTGAGNDAINAGLVLRSTDGSNFRGAGVFMHDLGGENEWFMGRPYAESDQFVINRRNGVSQHSTVTSSFGHNNSTQSTTNFFTVKASGKIGVGTTFPDSKLTVKGDIHAEEVKVDLSVPGPDYVFKEEYDLKSLEEVQKHIDEHGHLPNIPSAREMEANGIQLGEMNMKLLEKIEELTLYVIELKKENIQIKKTIESLKK